MDPEWKALFYAAAIVLWLIAAFKRNDNSQIRLTPNQLGFIGWALFAFPFLWDAVSAIE